MKLTSQHGHEITYTTTVFEAPIYAGQTGKHAQIDCKDRWYPPVYRDGELKRIGYFLNTARNVSYYSRLLKATGFKEV
jgi:hypothetical protein